MKKLLYVGAKINLLKCIIFSSYGIQNGMIASSFSFSQTRSMQSRNKAMKIISSTSTISQAYKSPLFSSSASPSNENSNEQTLTTLKKTLVQSIQYLRDIQERDGDISIDFGVKGGELNSTTRAPQKLDYYRISEEAGQACDRILDTSNELSKLTPNPDPVQYWKDDAVGNGKSPLNGEWKLLFTTAADATFSKNSTRGDAKAKNTVDVSKGTIQNTIEFVPSDDTPPVVKSFNVFLKASVTPPNRVNLQFRYVRVDLSKFFFLPISWSIYIPVPGPFFTKCILFLNKYIFFWKRKSKKLEKPPQAYFDIMYLDDQLRIHKTGEDNWFIQAKEANWKDAQTLLT